MTKNSQGPNKDFQLHTMGWQAFQDLCCVIAEVEFHRPVSRVSKNRDEGRDGFFFGVPEKPLGTEDARQTTIQAKHFSKAGSSLSLSTVAGDLEKVEALVRSGRAEGYILLSNGNLTEANRKEIWQALSDMGVKRPYVFGKEWIESKILEHHKIRALVPRIYGLGDLSWITDARSIDQAKAIIASMGRDLRCYVPTRSHQEAVEALSTYRFVLLLGDPAVGKSSIAAALSIAATDDNDVEVFFVRSPEEFLDHWDPNIENRLYWIDDAFGSIQYKPELMDRWNKVLSAMRAATDRGNRFIMTSRNYIWHQASRDLKKGVFSPLREGKIIVDVEQLTDGEKERILYNHLKYGEQPSTVLRQIRPFLDELVKIPSFRPEMARRLGDPVFTKNVVLTSFGIENFFKNAKAFLADTISGLSLAHQAALGAVFVAGGRLESPLSDSPEIETVTARFGVTRAGVGQALVGLEGSFVTLVEFGGERFWSFRHPTMADAYADIIADDPELVELYVKGVRVPQLLRESTAGLSAVQGAKVTIPASLYPDLLARLESVVASDASSVRQFLAQRSNDEFFEVAIRGLDQKKLLEGNLYRPASSHALSKIILRANKLGVLNADVRHDFIGKLRTQIEESGDVDFLYNEPAFEGFLTAQERQDLLEFARGELIDYVEHLIDNEAEGYGDTSDPDDFFEDLKYQLEIFPSLFPDDDEVAARVRDGFAKIDEKIEDLRYSDFERQSYDDYDGPRVSSGNTAVGRSIFDDLVE